MIVVFLSFLLVFSTCKSDRYKPNSIGYTLEDSNKFRIDTLPVSNILNQSKVPDGWKEILPSDNIILDIRYATTNNFTGKIIYNCGRCFLKKELVESILSISKQLKDSLGYGIKIFDCYRPHSAQKALWEIVPNPAYVTDPDKGSMHNRGSAIDLTIIDANGDDLDMGSSYDHFGRTSHIDNYNFDKNVLGNRAILFNIMKTHGWQGIRTEWWHYSKIKPYSGIADWEWECDIK